MSLSELSEAILCQYELSLTSHADNLPSGLTSDAYILEGSDCFSEKKNVEAFHNLSLSHATLLFHRYAQKALRQHSCSSENTNSSKDSLPNLSVISPATVRRASSPQETMDIIKSLPSDWTVVQVTCENRMSGEEREWRAQDDPPVNPTIFVSRVTCGPSPSLIVQKIRPPSIKNQVTGYLQELASINQENKVVTKYYMDDFNKYVAKREEINNRMKCLVRSMETAWLRHWCCLFQGSLNPKEETRLQSLVKKVLEKHKLTLSQDKLELLKLMISFPPASETKLSSNAQDIVNDFPLQAGVAHVLNFPVRNSTVGEVVKSLREMQKQIFATRKSLRQPLILILDKVILSLPWEMLFVMKNQSVTRMPSLHSLHLLYTHHAQKADSLLVKGINPSSGFYILDPEGNLSRSQERLKESFESTKWPGVVGRRPATEEFKEALSSKDIFVYAGHGSGSQYMPGRLVESMDCRSLVLLYGCSSAKLTERGSIPDPWGTVLNYLIAYCPCVVGMLWEVMDKDTDLLTKEMLRAIMGQAGPVGSPLEDPPTDISLLIARARPLCSWYMISAALVVYGLPLHIFMSD